MKLFSCVPARLSVRCISSSWNCCPLYKLLWWDLILALKGVTLKIRMVIKNRVSFSYFNLALWQTRLSKPTLEEKKRDSRDWKTSLITNPYWFLICFSIHFVQEFKLFQLQHSRLIWFCFRAISSIKQFFYFEKYGLLTKREVKMAGYWPSSFFACLWTETKSRSINSQKKNEANIQPSWLNKLGQ